MKESVVLQNLSIGYRTKGKEKVVAKGLDGVIQSGELICLLGRNGVGKSTLLRTLSAFLPPLQGNVLLQGKSLGDYTDQQLSRLIGVVLTEKLQVRNMKVEELVAMGRAPYTGFWGVLSETDRQVVYDAIQQVEVETLRGRLVQSLSDGERQKVMIAKALAQQTPVIYLDEPTAFLDYPSKVDLLQLLRRLAHEEQKTIFLSTHDVEISLQLADRLWLLTPQQLHVGTPAELAAQGVLSAFIEHEGITFNTDTLTIRIKK
jgi:iron complex transport system ATP-binding protein